MHNHTAALIVVASLGGANFNWGWTNQTFPLLKLILIPKLFIEIINNITLIEFTKCFGRQSKASYIKGNIIEN